VTRSHSGALQSCRWGAAYPDDDDAPEPPRCQHCGFERGDENELCADCQSEGVLICRDCGETTASPQRDHGETVCGDCKRERLELAADVRAEAMRDDEDRASAGDGWSGPLERLADDSEVTS